jgi:phosphopantothenoylcysteine synthetase/decarboxylase
MSYKPKNIYYVGQSKTEKIKQNIKNENNPKVLKDIIEIYDELYREKTGRNINDDTNKIKEKIIKKSKDFKVISSVNKIAKVFCLT